MWANLEIIPSLKTGTLVACPFLAGYELTEMKEGYFTFIV